MTASLLRCLPAAAVALALVAPAAATATELHTWYGTVVHISDGDTFEVDIEGDGEGPVVVRMTGVQAMEMHKASPELRHAVEAENSLRRLIDGKRVRLSAVDPDSRGLRDRLVRFVEVYRNGVWRDVNLAQLRRGHALWMPHPTETLRHLTYNRAAAAAATRGAALWDPDFCGDGPQQSVPLELWAQWDADSNDALNVNGEWVKLRNRSATETLSLEGWRLRDTALRQYTFPADTAVPPGQTLTVHVGAGTDSGLTRYWGLAAPIFENVPADRSLGDGAYLFDPDGDLRASFTYPCARLCSDPLQDQVKVSAVHYKSPESIQLRNDGTATVDLYGYLLESWPYSYDFPEGTTLAPGETLTISIGCPKDVCTTSRLKQYWYKYGDPTGQFLDNTGDTVRLRTFDVITIHCRSWGTATC